MNDAHSPADRYAARLEACYTGAVYDALRARGMRDQVLPPAIVPLRPGDRIAGPAFTVSGQYQDGAGEHETLLAWTEFLSAAPAGSIVVCQPNDDRVAHMGELSAETLQFRGVRGYVVDGGCRDTDFILRSGFPVWCRYLTPADVVGCWLVESLGEPITIGSTPIHPGDYLLADRDGVIVIPKGDADAVISATEEILQTENLVRKAILEGVDPKEAYLTHGIF